MQNRELAIFKDIEQLLIKCKNVVLMMEQKSSCNCNKPVKVFRCQEAHQISLKLEQLKNLRGS